jgi:hypothetical protein
MQTDNLMTQTKFAQHINKHRSYVTQLKQQGRIVMADDGKHVLVNESLNLIKETADYNRDDVVKRHQAEKQKKNGDEYDWLEDADPNKTSLAKGRAIEQHYKALSARMDYKASIGQYVDKDKAAAAYSDILATIKQSIDNLPSRVAADLVGKDFEYIRSKLKQEGFDMMKDLYIDFGKKLADGQN